MNCSLQFRLKGTTTRKHSLNLKFIKVSISFCNTNALQNVSYEEFNSEKGIYLRADFKMGIITVHLWMTIIVPERPTCQGWRRSCCWFCLIKAHLINSSSMTGLPISIMLFSTSNCSPSRFSMASPCKLNSSVQSSFYPAMFISSIMGGHGG